MKWHTLKSKNIIKDKWISLRADTCKMPKGHIVEPYYVLDYPTWVNVVAFTPNNQLVLVKLYRHGLGKVSIEIPSGAVEKFDESPMDAAKRELLEETGYGCGNFVQTGEISPNPSNHSNITKTFLATNVELIEKQNLDTTEEIEVLLLPFDQLKEQMMNGYFIQALHISSLFYALAHLKKL